MEGAAQDPLERLREALRETGYAEIVEGEAAEARLNGRSRTDSLDRLISALEDAVVPAMRASAEASGVLAELAGARDPDVGAFGRPPPDDPAAIHIDLDPQQADRITVEARTLERLLGELRRRTDADRS